MYYRLYIILFHAVMSVRLWSKSGYNVLLYQYPEQFQRQSFVTKKIMIKGNVRYLLPLYFELLIFSCWNHDISPQQNELHRSLIRLCASLVYDSIRFYVPMPKTQTVIIRQHSPILLLSHLVRLCFAASVSTTKRALVTFIFSSWNDASHILFNFTRVEVMLRLRGKSQTLEIIVIVIFFTFFMFIFLLCLFRIDHLFCKHFENKLVLFYWLIMVLSNKNV